MRKKKGLAEKLKRTKEMPLRDKIIYLLEHDHATFEQNGNIKLKKRAKRRLWKWKDK